MSLNITGESTPRAVGQHAERQHQHWRSAGLNTELSERIAVARTLAVLGLVYTHAPLPDALMTVTAEHHELAWQVRGFFADGIGRASAALLSVVSAWLMVQTAKRYRYGEILKRRVQSLITPWVAWGVLTVLIFAIGKTWMPSALATDMFDQGFLYLVNHVLFVTEVPYGPTSHLAFIRDLVVCMLLYPVLMWLIRQAMVPVLLFALAIYLLDLPALVVHRPLILLGYLLGLALADRRLDLTALDPLLPLFALISVLVLVLMNSTGLSRFYDPNMVQGLNLHDQVMMPLMRLFSSLTLWTLTARLVRLPVGRGLMSVASMIFVVYCSHFLTLRVVHAGLIGPLFGDASLPNLVFFIFSPAIALAATLAMVMVAGHLPAWLTGVFFGARPPARQPRSVRAEMIDTEPRAELPTELRVFDTRLVAQPLARGKENAPPERGTRRQPKPRLAETTGGD